MGGLGLKVEEDGEIVEDPGTFENVKQKQLAGEGNFGAATGYQSDGKPSRLQQSGWSRREANQRTVRRVNFKSCSVLMSDSLPLSLFFFFF